MTTLQVQTTGIPLAIQLPAMGLSPDEQFEAFCQANRELRVERTAQGEIIVMPPVHADTGNRNFNLAVELGKWAEADGTGLGFDSSAGFTLPNGAKRSPDAAWILLERWQALSPAQQAAFAPICPDFVVELRSASDSLSSLQDKLQEYIENGAQLGWLIDRKRRRAYCYRPGQRVQMLESPETVSGDPELAGFVLRMAKIW